MNSNSCPTLLVCELSFAWQLQLVQCNVIEGLQAAYVLRHLLPRYVPRSSAFNCNCVLKAAVYRWWLLPARALCKAMKAKVDETEVLHLLHHSWTTPAHSVYWHNRSLGYSEESSGVATILRMNRPGYCLDLVRELTRPFLEDLGHNDCHVRTRSDSQPHQDYACTPSKKPRQTKSDTPS
jgi:hypothetical protein